MIETVTTGRAKRSTAGNRMRELLEKAHQDDAKEDNIFAEEPDDDEFEEPALQRDVFLDEFADTDDEMEDEDDEEGRVRKEERRARKGKAAFNPLVKVRGLEPVTQMPSAEEIAILNLDPSVDVSKMAPSTLILEIRKRKREVKRLHRSETRRANLRASTLRTEQEVIEREEQEKIAAKASRKGRKAQHITGEVRGSRPMTQAELIAAALEEEERNKEALTDWLRREEERRELRRVGRKRVRGPRWTFVSRTVGKLVEVVEDAQTVEQTPAETPAASGATEAPPPTQLPGATATISEDAPGSSVKETDGTIAAEAAKAEDGASTAAPAPPTLAESAPRTAGPAPAQTSQTIASAGPSLPPTEQPPANPDDDDAPTGPYTRNYLILSKVPGGLSNELSLILGDHVDWSNVKVIPARNRPINRRVPLDPLTGVPGKYRHPASMVPYTGAESYATLEAVLQNRYVWSSGGWWAGGEADAAADGVEDIPGWKEACSRGWLNEQQVPQDDEEQEVAEETEARGGRKRRAEPAKRAKPAKKSRRR